MVRMKYNIYRLLFFSLIITAMTGVAVEAQSKSELETRRLNAKKEIEYTNNLLQETQKNKTSTLNKVKILNTRIRLRNELISAINSEIALIEEEIHEKENMILSLESDLTRVRKEYEKLVIYAYWNKSNQDRMMFIMSAENFNQAYKRIKYIQQLTRHRKKQAILIEELKSSIVTEVDELQAARLSREALALEKSNESHSLAREISSNNQVVNNLKKRERELKNKIAEKIRIADKLEKEIAEIIAEEARKRSSRNVNMALTPEEKLISDNFLGNKGKIPWPTERGVITAKYGKHRHPVLTQVITQNDGVDISTVEGAEARAMFGGVVSKVFPILGENLAIIIRHGDFYTVYQGIVDVKVKKGDLVEVKQVLGRIYTDRETSSTILHIEIWQELNKQNPEDWLSKRN